MKLGSGIVLAAAIAVALLATAGFAGGRKIMVLPVDGNADAATRSKLDQALQKLAHLLDGDVKVGATSFADGATAVGCDPEDAACADTVIGTLGVDELVWGTATTSDSGTTFVVKRASKGTPPKAQTVKLEAVDPPDKAEVELKPLFGGAAEASGSGSGSGSGGSGSGSDDQSLPFSGWSRDKKLGVGLASGGGLVLALGLVFWLDAHSLQGDIDSAPTTTLAQIQSLRAKEDDAASRATWGNVMVVVGLAAGATGAYFLWKDHEHPVSAVAVPADQGTGATLVIGGRW